MLLCYDKGRVRNITNGSDFVIDSLMSLHKALFGVVVQQKLCQKYSELV